MRQRHISDYSSDVLVPLIVIASHPSEKTLTHSARNQYRQSLGVRGGAVS